MKIAFTKTALTSVPLNNDITFDLSGRNIYARGVKFAGTDTTYDVFTGATSTKDGALGLVKKPVKGDLIKYLKGDGTWSIVDKAQTLSSDGVTSNVFVLPYYGYSTLNTEFGTTGTANETYFKNYLKKLIKSHNTSNNKVGIGTLSPNSQHISLFRAYDLTAHTDGLPEHSSGFSISLEGRPITWGTSHGSWYYNLIAYKSEIPTKVSDLENDSGYVTGGPYLPISGGTLTGTLTIEKNKFGSLIIYRKDSTNSASIQFKNGDDVSLGYLGMNLADGSLLRFSADTTKSYKLWDADNDGSGSGLDADLLDGIHASGLFTALSNVHTNTYPYSISATIGGTTRYLNVNYANSSFKLVVLDIRDTTPTPKDASDKVITAWFNNTDKPTNKITWYSGITVAGWGDSHVVWQLASNSCTLQKDSNLYVRNGLGDTWNSWRTVLDSDNTHIKDGVITINGTTITPLTLHLSLDDYIKWNSTGYYNISRGSKLEDGNIRFFFSNIDNDSCLGLGYEKSTNKVYLTNYQGKSLSLTDKLTYGTDIVAYTTTNFPSNQINILTGYAKATSIGAITTTDSLNIALGKLEFKTDFIYNDLFGTDNDDVINKWHEIVNFIDSVKETETDILDTFVTIKTDLTITGSKTFSLNYGTLFVLGNKSSYPTITVDSSGGWDRAYALVNIKNSNSKAAFGVLGSGTGIDYAYISIEDQTYVNPIFKVYKDKVSAPKFVTINGTSTLFVKGDGTLDSTTYATSASLGNYLPLTGGTLTGLLTLGGNSYTKTIKWANSDYNTTTAIAFMGSGGDWVVRVTKTSDGSTSDLRFLHSGNLSVGGKTVLHSGNYTEYLPILNSSSTHATNSSVIYAPSTAGTKGLILTSNGSGAPIWSGIKYLKFTLSDNVGRDSYLLIADLSDWKTGTSSDISLIGSIYGHRGGNLSLTDSYNIVALCTSYTTGNWYTLYTSTYTTRTVLPYIVKYNGKNYLALRKRSSGDDIYFVGYASGLSATYTTLNVPAGSTLPANMEIVHYPSYTSHALATTKLCDGNGIYNILHESNYNNYAPKLDGTGASGTWNIDINGNATTATTLKQNLFNSGHDLNTIASESVYVNTKTNVCTSLINGPEGRSNGEIRLESVNCGSDKYGFQTLYTRNTTNYEIWYRTWAFSTYTPWVKALHSGIAYIKDGTITINGTSITPVTSRGYIGTTAVQASSAAQALTGITNLSMNGTYNNNNKLYINSSGLIYPYSTSTRTAGVYGVYDSNKVGHVWSMGTAYKIADDGSSTNNMYGLVYFHTNWSNSATNNATKRDDALITEVSAYAGDHQIAFVKNGKVMSALGDGVWSRYGFIKNGSSNDYVLLGGGGHKALSDFLLETEFANKELSSNLIEITKSLKLTKDWLDTGIILNDDTFTYGSGTYAVQVYIDAGSTEGFWYSYFSGIMSVYTGYTNSGNPDDEIILHHSAHASDHRIYLKTKPTSGGSGYYSKLYIACNKNFAAARNIKFKFKKLI